MQWTSGYELRKLTAKWTRTFSGAPTQDAAVITMHFLNLTAGNPDSTWTTADYTTVETAFDTFWATLTGKYVPGVVLAELNWRADGPAYRPKGSLLSPTLRTVARNVPGTAVGQMLPPQAAMTVTEVTAAKYTAFDVEGVGDQLRNRWGRFYLPAMDVQVLGNGRFLTTHTGTVATSTQAMYNTCVAADLIPVMYSPTTGSSWSITEVHVDDIIDVVRSRRFDSALNRQPKTINQPA